MKKFLLVVVLALIYIANPIFVYAQVPQNSQSKSQELLNEIYQEQKNLSGAEKIKEQLPQGALKDLEDIGVNGIEIEDLMKITPETIVSKIGNLTYKASKGPFKVFLIILSLILLSALINIFGISFKRINISATSEILSVLCVLFVVLSPILHNIESSSRVLKGAANFMFCYIPVMAGIMLASGQAMAASSFYGLMLVLCEAFSQIASNFLIPILSSFLALAAVSSICGKIDLESFCQMLFNILKWILSALMTVFVSVLTLQNIIATAADSTGSKTMKFMLNSFIPVVGGALGDAFLSVSSCLKLLKSGVGAFAIIASAAIFLPILAECVLLMFSLSLGSNIAQMFELKNISNLLKNINKVASTNFAIILCCLAALIISSGIILIVGSGG